MSNNQNIILLFSDFYNIILFYSIYMKKCKKYFDSGKKYCSLDPDPEEDPDWNFWLDPDADPDSMNMDPKHWFKNGIGLVILDWKRRGFLSRCSKDFYLTMSEPVNIGTW